MNTYIYNKAIEKQKKWKVLYSNFLIKYIYKFLHNTFFKMSTYTSIQSLTTTLSKSVCTYIHFYLTCQSFF